jgi:hydroxymethylglutaryl-CoA reductase
MNKILQDVDLAAKDEVSKLEDEVLNPSNNPHAPIVVATVDTLHAVDDVILGVEVAKTHVEDLIGKVELPLGLPGGGV